MIFNDVTELTHITDLYYAETPAVAYIVIDNLEEIAQYVKGSYRAEANQVENIYDYMDGKTCIPSKIAAERAAAKAAKEAEERAAREAAEKEAAHAG